MLIESNRLHQKIKRLKEELTREKEMRREAEKQLRLLHEAIASTHKNQVLEMTIPDNIAVEIISESSNATRVDEKVTECRPETGLQSETNSQMISKTMEFLQHFSKSLLDQNESEIYKCYDDYKKNISTWCWPDTLEKIDGSTNSIVTALFQELYQRTSSTAVPYSKLWSIYMELFSDKILSNHLPDVWIYDIFNAFVYKFQDFNSSEPWGNWRKELIVETLEKFISNSHNKESTIGEYSAVTALLRLYIFFEDSQNISKLACQLSANMEAIQKLPAEVSTKINYEIGFALLLSGKSMDAVLVFLKILDAVAQCLTEEKEVSLVKSNTKRCIAFCISSNSKIRKSITKNTVSIIEKPFKKDIEDWKDGQVEAYWNFFSMCSPYIIRQNSSQWKNQNFKSVRFCLQKVTMWKPLRYLKGMLKVVEVLPFEAIPKSIIPVTSDSDIRYFCNNNNGLKRLVNAKCSAIERVLEDFPNIQRKETLNYLIMQYHKILLKHKNEDKILAFGRKFVNVLKSIGLSGKVNVEEAMCYIREVAKISMEEANKIVEDQCSPE
uniref:Nuclear pore complex protein Nup85 n=1 Tax=Caenorhabditis tropicalis TaxID=1561998 RepID=A0A1I7TG39_9PELO